MLLLKLVSRAFGCVLLLALLFSPCRATTLWVVGALEDSIQNEDYQRNCTEMADFYRRFYPDLRVVHELKLSKLSKDSTVIYCGPIGAFRRLKVLGLPLEILSPSALKIDGVKLGLPDVGFFIKSFDGTRQLYSGTSLAGFDDIWKVPTGKYHCTVTRRRRVLWQGNYQQGVLAMPQIPFLSRLPRKAEASARIPSCPEEVLGTIAVVQVRQKEPTLLDPLFTKWFDRKLEGKKALFVGESHWSRTQADLFQELLFHVVSSKGPSCLVLEEPYSCSAYFDHFVQLRDDQSARRFFEKSLRALITYESTKLLLEAVRAWNCRKQGYDIRVACIDLEWSRSKITEGEYPFVTAQYCARVQTNLRDTLQLDRDRFAEERQKAIVRNLGSYCADFMDKRFIVCKGGNYHAIKALPRAGAPLRDAAFLQHVHAPTKDGVFTLTTRVLGYDFSPVADLDLERYKLGADNYREFVTAFRQGLLSGHARRGDFYLLDDPSLLELALLHRGLMSDVNILAVERVNTDAIEARYGRRKAGSSGDWTQFDASIVILASQLDRTLPR